MIKNGQKGNATNLNAAFVSKTKDTETTGVLALRNTLPASGAEILNAQKEINDLKAKGWDSQKTLTNTNFNGGAFDANHRVKLPIGATQAFTDNTPDEGLIAYDSVKKKIVFGNGSAWGEVTGGGGGGNSAGYAALNPDAEASVSGWTKYFNTAGVQPVDGVPTGTEPLSTWTRETGSPMRGLASFAFYKPASNRQGDGVAFDFTIDPADRGKKITITCDYQMFSGTYADNDQIFYVSAVSAPTVMLGSTKLAKHLLPSGEMRLEFQALIDQVNYRLMLHVASTSAVAYVNQFDNFKIGIPSVSRGAFIGNPAQYTAALVGFGTVPSQSLWWYQEGATLTLYGKFTTGTPTAVTAKLPLPNGLVVGGSVGERFYVGEIIRNGQAQPYRLMGVQGNNFLTFGAGTSQHGDLNGDGVLVSGETVYLKGVSVPIQGWSSNMVLSSESSGRLMSVSGALASNVSLAPTTLHTIAITNTAGDFASGGHTIKETGRYFIFGSVTWDSVGNTSVQENKLFVNSSQVGYSANQGGSAAYVTTTAFAILDIVAGDVVTMRSNHSSASAKSLIGGLTSLSIYKLGSGSSTIVQGERVCATYGLTTAQSVAAGGIIKYDTKVEDTHGLFNPATGLFTANFMGKLAVNAVGNPNGAMLLGLKKNGVGAGHFATIASGGLAGSTIELFVNVGDTVGVCSDAAVSMFGLYLSQFTNQVTFKRAT